MVLDLFKNRVREYLKPLVLLVSGKGIKPNYVTFLSLVLAFFSAYFFYRSYLVVGAFFMSISGILDVFDGLLARLNDLDTDFGDFLDHTIDRTADSVILVGLIFSPVTSRLWGFLSLIGVLLTGYVGTQAEAIGFNRIYGGLFSRSDIFSIIFLAALLSSLFNGKIFGIFLMDWGLIILALGSNFTAVQRAFLVWKKF
ncbi:MAG: Phosphatidylglycerophosphate synthase PgsA [Candidatus Methanohalarchaeum thermophilum]|uniref:Phosphatidylglycerophosphate synthase PgsA n=1 Tax=Methanohalarchaeum thermophilum TaxID=1903181 RepID=A0A1Q6DUX5_METT1|nr:MAG: Phosphatidylglycerophosphate synthase PgsA [Candidatus Methanohalarchaeum thermophilum]